MAERGRAGLLMVGYNRRFSPLSALIKKELSGGPLAMIYRVNSGAIPKESWIQDNDLGGGRIIGEVCHFIDLLTYFTGSVPVSVYASAMRAAENTNDTLTVNLHYENGSIGTVCYFANGDKSLPKERIEIFAGGRAAVLEDFRSVTVHSRGRQKDKKLLVQDKGQKTEIQLFLDAVIKGGSSPIPFDELCMTSHVTFKVLESLRTGNAVRVSEYQR